MQAEKMIEKKMDKAGNTGIACNDALNIERAISHAWKKIAPWWPLKYLIAVNPLQGFEHLSFENAMTQGYKYFQNTSLQQEMEAVNRQTIKWCQVCFDEGQAVIDMPGRDQGVFQSWRRLIVFDDQLHKNDIRRLSYIKSLPDDAESVIQACLVMLKVTHEDTYEFLSIQLTTLPGWAGYVKYQNGWKQGYINHKNGMTQAEFLAMRLIITCLLWFDTPDLFAARAMQHIKERQAKNDITLDKENEYKKKLLSSLLSKENLPGSEITVPDCQLVFCIDVRSEPLRHAIESEGKYETYGFAGFFGIPVIINNKDTGKKYASCPVLISPNHVVNEISHPDSSVHDYAGTGGKIYQALKYTFTTPFILADMIGLWSGIWMALKTIMPTATKKYISALFQNTKSTNKVSYDLSHDQSGCGIALNDQCVYAEKALRMMGLTSKFAKIIVLCGHGSVTENNAVASALDCGACGGHDGSANAIMLATMLNNSIVRERLKQNGIVIPESTIFIAALHHTTTDQVDLLGEASHQQMDAYINLQNALQRARIKTNAYRLTSLANVNKKHAVKNIYKRSADWAETRPEWGLARNASFIVGPRHMTKGINLDGRSFLHSYDWQGDADGALLTTILTAPMVVAQWINCQYLFSTIDNIAYGSGSKVTHNVTGKIGLMQGNASDLMSGLSLQSVMKSDSVIYHEPLRLLTIVYAPRKRLEAIIKNQAVLQKLFGNRWVSLVCIDPTDATSYELATDWSWRKVILSSLAPNFVTDRLIEKYIGCYD